MFSFFQNIFYNRSLRKMRQILESLQVQDYSLRFKLDGLRGEERRVAEELNNIIGQLREAEHQRARDSQFFEALLATVNAMLIAVNEEGSVRWMNQPAIVGLCGFKINALDDLAVIHPGFPKQLREVRTSKLVSFTMTDGEVRQYAATKSKLFCQGICYELYSLQRVETMVQQSEVEAQQRLVRVLNHEIMNSLAPIISLSQTLIDDYPDSEEEASLLSNKDAQLALSAIHRRAAGLLQFVENYRKISGVAPPKLQPVCLSDLLTNIQQLVLNGEQGMFVANAAEQTSAVPKFTMEIDCADITIQIDRAQIEQVLINLLKNAVEAAATNVLLRATLVENERWLLLTVSDNGHGFAPQAVDKLFVPFYTTKQGGQGIGLALCHQIVNNHAGVLKARSLAEGGATFSIKLPIT